MTYSIGQGMKVNYRFIFGMLVLLMIFTSCANSKLRGWQTQSENKITIPENYWFGKKQQKALYKINIEAFHQKQSGMLFVKQADSSSIRLLMLTEFGLKVFDIQYYIGDSVKLHYIMNHLDNPYISNALIDNFKVLWPKILSDARMGYFYNEKEKKYLYRLESEGEDWRYQMNQNMQTTEIQRLNTGTKKALIQINNQMDEFFISTKHPKILIRLKKIEDAAE